MILTKFPRVKLCDLPTPIEKLERLSKHLGVNLYFKRDDLTALAGGGNKVRKLEFLMGDAIAKGADTVITQGAVQSNHVRQTIAACAKLGLKCRAILERRNPTEGQRFEKTGNVLLDHLLGVENLRFVGKGVDMNAEMQKDAEEVKAAGGKPYIIPGGGSNAVGALGYVNAATEILGQMKKDGLKFDHITVTSGSSGTHAGLVAGFHADNADVDLLGIAISQPDENLQIEKVYAETVKTLELIGAAEISKDKVKVNNDYVGPGYGVATEETMEALMLAAQYEGILLDIIYTAKAFAGVIGLIRNGTFKKNSNILFIHTGGSQGLPAYEDEIMEYLNSKK